MKLEQITAALVNAAIETYLRLAYDEAGLREAHQVRFAPQTPVGELLSQFSRESVTPASYCLRLGCQWYPHMKMCLSESYFPDEYVFVVDRHDGFDFSMSGPGYEQWMGMRSRNHRVKLAIEEAWYAQGVPTLRSLREDRLSRSDIVREFRGDKVLIVDNDTDTAAIVEMILAEAGYASQWVSSVADVAQILEAGEGPFGLALVDVLLADGTGLDVARLLRGRAATQELPILLLSGLPEGEVDQSEVDGYLRKPYSSEQLLRLVESTLRRRRSGMTRRARKS